MANILPFKSLYQPIMIHVILLFFLNDSSTAKAACETFALTYSNDTTDISEKTMNMERMVGQIPVPKPRVIPTKDAKVSEGLRRLTLQIAIISIEQP